MAQPDLSRPQKKAKEEERTLVFIDESAFYLLPHKVRTYAPMGRTPVFSVPLTHDHVSAIGAITPQGRIFMQTQRRSYKSHDVIGFLKQLLRTIPGKLLIIWDGASIHRSQMIKDFLAQEGAARLHLEHLPAYAPDLNLQEGVWNLLKRRELKNVCCQTLQQLDDALLLAKARLLIPTCTTKEYPKALPFAMAYITVEGFV